MREVHCNLQIIRMYEVPDNLKMGFITLIAPIGLCPKYCVNEKTGFRYNLLYLDSVFKYKNKLVHNQTPIMNWLCPFLLNFHQ